MARIDQSDGSLHFILPLGPDLHDTDITVQVPEIIFNESEKKSFKNNLKTNIFDDEIHDHDHDHHDHDHDDHHDQFEASLGKKWKSKIQTTTSNAKNKRQSRKYRCKEDGVEKNTPKNTKSGHTKTCSPLNQSWPIEDNCNTIYTLFISQKPEYQLHVSEQQLIDAGFSDVVYMYRLLMREREEKLTKQSHDHQQSTAVTNRQSETHTVVRNDTRKIRRLSKKHDEHGENRPKLKRLRQDDTANSDYMENDNPKSSSRLTQTAGTSSVGYVSAETKQHDTSTNGDATTDSSLHAVASAPAAPPPSNGRRSKRQCSLLL